MLLYYGTLYGQGDANTITYHFEHYVVEDGRVYHPREIEARRAKWRAKRAKRVQEATEAKAARIIRAGTHATGGAVELTGSELEAVVAGLEGEGEYDREVEDEREPVGRFMVNPSTGEILLNDLRVGQYKVALHAKDGHNTIVVREWLFEAVEGDLCEAGNGPGGRGCREGARPVDEVEGDGAYTCDCTQLNLRQPSYDWSGPNCHTRTPTGGIQYASNALESWWETLANSPHRTLAAASRFAAALADGARGAWLLLAALLGVVIFLAIAYHQYMELEREEQIGHSVHSSLATVAAGGNTTSLAKLVKVLGEAKVLELCRVPNHRGEYPFMVAASNGGIAMVTALYAIDPGSFKLVSTRYRNTALHLASHRGRDEVVALLLTKKETDVDAVCSLGRTALHYTMASSRNVLKCTRLLLRHGAMVDAVDDHDNTPLHCSHHSRNFTPQEEGASQRKRRLKDVIAAVRMLVAWGADVNAKDSAGRTVLCLAVARKPPAVLMMRALLHEGADLWSRCRLGDVFTCAKYYREGFLRDPDYSHTSVEFLQRYPMRELFWRWDAPLPGLRHTPHRTAPLHRTTHTHTHITRCPALRCTTQGPWCLVCATPHHTTHRTAMGVSGRDQGSDCVPARTHQRPRGPARGGAFVWWRGSGTKESAVSCHPDLVYPCCG